MNAPFRAHDALSAAGTLNLFALFHLNLAFSSIEEEQRAEVIARCYWPLLDLAEKHGPSGIEITGYTLEEIARLDPEWIGRAKALLGRGAIELIGSGYAQIIGPLVPARVTEENLKIGNEVYRRLLDTVPTLALINEQAYSAGLVGLYLDAGYRAILMDWDNCAAQHTEWPLETRYRPQAALGADGRSIGLIWTNTVAFQKLQRFAHGDIERDAYLDYVREQADAGERALCLYASDAEIFDFRPGRYRTEEAMRGGEWQRLAQALEAIADESNMRMVRPSEILSFGTAGKPLRLESAACPIPVKKQRKYNLARWAVTGRDDTGINATCERVYRGLATVDANDVAWKELCILWSSDFRTHITEKRWTAYCERLRSMEARYCAQVTPPVPQGEGGESVALDLRHIDVETPSLRVRLDRRRGLAIEWLHFASHDKPVIGGLPHGYFDDISIQADWYTGDCVFEAPGEPKVTDLEWCEARRRTLENGDVCITARVETPNGPIEKSMTFGASESRVDFDIVFHWQNWGRGSLRLGHFTLLPDAFDPLTLSLTTHNGGKYCETFSLAGQSVDHGAPVSFLVSSSHGLGMTEGWAELGDAKTRVRIDVDRPIAPLLGLLAHRNVGGRLFCQLALSALELDDTCKPSPYCEGPRRFRFSVSAA
jgi:hypothetical protein